MKELALKLKRLIAENKILVSVKRNRHISPTKIKGGDPIFDTRLHRSYLYTFVKDINPVTRAKPLTGMEVELNKVDSEGISSLHGSTAGLSKTKTITSFVTRGKLCYQFTVHLHSLDMALGKPKIKVG